MIQKTDGYSGKSLIEKLGLKEGSGFLHINSPEGYLKLLAPLPKNLRLHKKPEGEIDFIHFFTASEAELTAQLPLLKKHLAKNGMLWISWPKKSSKMTSDLTENKIRAAALNEGLVDVKVCAFDQTWSGLKLVYRLKDR